MLRGVSGVLLCLLLLLQTAHAQPEAGPGMAVASSIPPTSEALILALDGINRRNNPVERIDLFKPEATVRSFIWALNRKDVDLARKCVLNAAPTDSINYISDFLWFKLGRYAAFSIRDFHLYVSENEALATFWLDTIHPGSDDEPSGSSERLRLQRVGGLWLIAPQSTAKTSPRSFLYAPIVTDFTEMLAMGMTNKLTVQDAWNSYQCLSHMKESAMVILQYVLDAGDVFPGEDGLKERLAPFHERETIFRCPSMDRAVISYSYNAALTGVSLKRVNTVASTILMYEGIDRKFDFRHQVEGEKRSHIVFVDGHVKAFTKAELNTAFKSNTVRW